MTAQQFSGINIMAFYSSTIFAQAGYDAKHTLLASFGFGLVNFVFAFPAIWTIDTFGRRNLLLFTFPNMAWCLVAGGCCFLLPQDSSARLPLIAFFVYLFTAFYSPGKPARFSFRRSFFTNICCQELDPSQTSTQLNASLSRIERSAPRHASSSTTHCPASWV